MKSKKFVLAALALLTAITMVLLPLAGCKNDTVPETPAAKLVSISVTPSEGTVYKVGDEVVHKKGDKIEVTATYDDGEERTVTGTITTDTGTLTQSAGIGKKVTVSYTEGDTTKEATFTIDVASYEFTETVQDVDSSYAGTMTGGNYKKFGDWPQTIKDKDVTVGKNTMTRGGMDFHVGSDGNYYVEQKENAKGSGTEYKYSNGDQAGQGGTSTKWFKVEPIVWRVLTTSFKAPEGGTAGNDLLLAEKILTGGVPYYDVYDVDRTVDGATIYPNNYEHSAVRAWLNGLEYQYKKDANTAQTTEKKYLAAGFLQTAFTESAQTLIADTTVDNSAASTNPASNPKQWEEGENPYASNTPTTDKVFLLSEKEATTESYGFGEYSESGTGNTRIRVTTDYAKATGAYQGNPSAGSGGWWWLRSPCYDIEDYARVILNYGYADIDYNRRVDDTDGGVVPALSISLK